LKVFHALPSRVRNEMFLAEIGDALLNVQSAIAKFFKSAAELENFLAHRRADFKRLRGGILLQLANVECGFPRFRNPDLDEFGRAAFEYAPVREWSRCRGPLVQSGARANAASRKNRSLGWEEFRVIARLRCARTRRGCACRAKWFPEHGSRYNARSPGVEARAELSRLDMAEGHGQRVGSISGFQGFHSCPGARAP